VTEDYHEKSSVGLVAKASSRNYREKSRRATHSKAARGLQPRFAMTSVHYQCTFAVRLGRPFVAVFAGQSRFYGL
jgi:hypothetical protein